MFYKLEKQLFLFFFFLVVFTKSNEDNVENTPESLNLEEGSMRKRCLFMMHLQKV